MECKSSGFCFVAATSSECGHVPASSAVGTPFRVIFIPLWVRFEIRGLVGLFSFFFPIFRFIFFWVVLCLGQKQPQCSFIYRISMGRL